MRSIESFEIRFGRADFCCAVGFRPHLALHFEPIAENICISLDKLNAETTSANLGIGRCVTYVTNANVRSPKVSLQLLEKNDFNEFQKIATADFFLKNGSYEGSVWFTSLYDNTFELGTIDVCAQIIIKDPSYNPEKTKGRKKKKSKSRRPKTAPCKSVPDSSDILDISRIQPEISRLKLIKSIDCADVGAASNPPPLFYRSMAPITASAWQPVDSARIIEKLKNGTEVPRPVIVPPKPIGDARVLKPSEASTHIKECPLVTQIIDELNLLNSQYNLGRGRDLFPTQTVDAIRTLKEYTKAVSSTNMVPVNDEDNESTVPIAHRRHTAPPMSNSNCSLRASHSRIRQNVHSGTYDRYGRPTFKPVYSSTSLTKATVDSAISVQSFVSNRSSRCDMTRHNVSAQSSRTDLHKRPEQKCATTQTTQGASLRQQTVLAVDIGGIDVKPSPPPPTPTPRSTTNQSTKTSLHISMPSLASVTSMSQTSIQYSDDFVQESVISSSSSSASDLEEDIFEKSRSDSFNMTPQRSQSPQVGRKSSRKV